MCDCYNAALVHIHKHVQIHFECGKHLSGGCHAAGQARFSWRLVRVSLVALQQRSLTCNIALVCYIRLAMHLYVCVFYTLHSHHHTLHPLSKSIHIYNLQEKCVCLGGRWVRSVVGHQKWLCTSLTLKHTHRRILTLPQIITQLLRVAACWCCCCAWAPNAFVISPECIWLWRLKL